MPDKPIIFSAPMVRALLDGRKSQTRRVLKPQPEPWAEAVEVAPYKGYGRAGELIQRTRDDSRQHGLGKAPYAVGDRLWVRETLTSFGHYGDKPTAHYPADHTGVPHCGAAPGRADGRAYWQWKRNTLPSIHMPRWASRLTLLVTGVKVERLQEISEEDARAEGVRRIGDNFPGATCFDDGPNFYTVELTGQGLSLDWSFNQPTARECFAGLWNHLHGDEAWQANPWVVAITFTVHRANIDQLTKEAA